MKKPLSLRVAAYSLLLLALLGVNFPTATEAQSQSQLVAPVDLHRFIVNKTELGTLLTTNFQEGVNLNFAGRLESG